MLSFSTNTYLETLYADDIERFRCLHFNVENRLETNIVYTDFSTHRRLTTEQKNCCPDKRRQKMDESFTRQRKQIFRLQTYASKIGKKHVIKIKICWKSLVEHNHRTRAIFYKSNNSDYILTDYISA